VRRLTFSFLSPIHRATRQIARHLSGPCGAEGVAAGEGHLLSYLRSYGPCPVGDLLRVFGHKPSTMTSMLNRLEAAGLVTRGESPGDRRVVLVGLTRRGAAAADRLREHLVALEAAIRANVGDREIEGFRAVLAAIEAAAAPTGGTRAASPARVLANAHAGKEKRKWTRNR
jgi:DNA-binding MarR family transcriptional regulator